jgi:hypothetical protein
MMNYETRLSKNQKIAQHGKDTRNRRKNQDCKVFSIKIQTNKLSHIQKEQLKMLFVEAKWLKNDILAKGVKGYVIGNEVDVKTPAGYVSRKFEYLGSRIRQSVLAETKQNIKVLSVLKKKGRHVGKLKFVSEVKELDLAQYGKTYKIKANKVHIQNVNGWMIAG